jgi:hypothetical protein
MSDKIKAYVPKTFRDAGTGETFEGGKEHSFHPGAHHNYRTAGLIGDPPTKAEAPAPDAPKGKGA